MNMISMMKTLTANGRQKENQQTGKNGGNFDIRTLSTILPIIMGMKNGTPDITNLLGIIAGLSRGKPNTYSDDSTVSAQNLNHGSSADKKAEKANYSPDFLVEIPFAGDEVVYFLQKMRILSAK